MDRVSSRNLVFIFLLMDVHTLKTRLMLSNCRRHDFSRIPVRSAISSRSFRKRELHEKSILFIDILKDKLANFVAAFDERGHLLLTMFRSPSPKADSKGSITT